MAHVRKIGELGKYTSYVTLPKELVGSLGWRRKQRVTVSRVKGGLVIRDARSRKKALPR